MASTIARPGGLCWQYVYAVCLFGLLGSPAHSSADEQPSSNVDGCDLASIVQKAFSASHDGWSSDEVLLQDDLNAKFISICKDACPSVATRELNRALLNRRKAGRLEGTVIRSRSDRHVEYKHVAEIVARLLSDKHQVNTDEIMCDPALRKEFDSETKRLAPDIDSYLLRKAAFGLRKSRRLRPEFVVRIADWGREITAHSVAALQADPELIPNRPGVYIFRDSTGYLYVGESKNLRTRLKEHLDDSDRTSLAKYLVTNARSSISIEIHSFDPESKAKETRIRRAYESEIIASRSPRFNVRP